MTDSDVHVRDTRAIDALRRELGLTRARLVRLQLLSVTATVIAVAALAGTFGLPGPGQAQAQMYPGPAPYPGQRPDLQGPPRSSGHVTDTDRSRILARARDAALADPADFDAEAAIAVYLHDIARQLEATNGRLEAVDRNTASLTHLANEMRELNLKMNVVTQSIDSTMGTMGRIMNYMLYQYQ